MKIFWVFDVVSPFSYLGLKQLSQMPPAVSVQFVPVLFAGLLEHFGQLGNAEVAPKRRFTYRFVLWRARRMGVAMRMPPTHPFNPLAALRLILAGGCDGRAVNTVMDAAYLHGRDIADPRVIEELGGELDIEDPHGTLADPAVKQRLRANTQWAIERGAFGVPTFVIESETFWGHDAFDMALDYLRDPDQFETPQMQAVESLPIGVTRSKRQA
jgi:2-hydroxychromene-2-carboxylate isomerase